MIHDRAQFGPGSDVTDFALALDLLVTVSGPSDHLHSTHHVSITVCNIRLVRRSAYSRSLVLSPPSPSIPGTVARNLHFVLFVSVLHEIYSERNVLAYGGLVHDFFCCTYHVSLSCVCNWFEMRESSSWLVHMSRIFGRPLDPYSPQDIVQILSLRQQKHIWDSILTYINDAM